MNRFPDVDILHIGKDSLHERAYLALKRALILGRFRPGQRLLLKPLAEELGISVTPVREALQRLVSEHGLVSDRSRTMVVPILSVPRFREIRDIRIELEGRAVEAAAKVITSQGLARLEEIQKSILRHRLAGDAQGALADNQAFHFLLYRLADLPVLLSLIEGLWVRIGPLLTCLYEHSGPIAVREHPHVAILEALSSRDPAAARLAVVNDIMWASGHLEKAVAALIEQSVDDSRKANKGQLAS